MSIDIFSGLERIHSIVLEESERLLVHMDCMNSFGQIVKIEDVDDMGGQVPVSFYLSDCSVLDLHSCLHT